MKELVHLHLTRSTCLCLGEMDIRSHYLITSRASKNNILIYVKYLSVVYMCVYTHTSMQALCKAKNVTELHTALAYAQHRIYNCCEDSLVKQN